MRRISKAIIILSLLLAPGSGFSQDKLTCRRCEQSLSDLFSLQNEKPEFQKLLQKNTELAEDPRYRSANVKIQSNRLIILRRIQDIELRDQALRGELRSEDCQSCPNVKGKVSERR